MKSKNFLSNLWSLLVGSQRNDVEFDRRLTVGSPSGFTINWTLKLVSVLAILMTIGVGNAWGTPAPVNTVLWEETWTGAKTATSGNNNATPSANYGKGTTVYNSGTVTYTQSANTVYVRDEKLAGGSVPELMLSSGKTWTISGIPTGEATELTLTYKSNNTKSSVTCSTDDVDITGSSKSYTIDLSESEATTITLVFSCSGNTRIDDVQLTVKTAGSGGGSSCGAPTSPTNGSINMANHTKPVSWTAPSSAPAGGYLVAYSTATNNNPGTDVYATGGNYTVMSVAAGTTSASIPCGSAGTYNWWVRSKCSTSDNSSCSGWVKGTAFTMYSMTYNANGGSGTTTDSNSPYESGATVTVASNSFTHASKVFSHWNTQNDDLGTDRSPGGTFTISSNTTLYAQWGYGINWSVSGQNWNTGHGTPSLVAYPNGTFDVMPTNPTTEACDGSKVFVGWTATPIVGTQNTAPTDLFLTPAGAPTVDKNTTFYAVFATAATKGTRVTGTAGMVSGNYYVIVNAQKSATKLIKSDLTAGSTIPDETNSEISTQLGECWLITGDNSTNGFTIASLSNKTMGLSSSPSNGTAISNTASSSKWIFGERATDFLRIWNKSYTSYKIEHSSSNWVVWNSTSDDYVNMKVYKLNFTNYATACETCDAPTGVASSSVGNRGATLTVTDANDVNKYDFYCNTSSTQPASNATPTDNVNGGKSKAISSLNYGTKYYYWARTVCTSVSSDWYPSSSPSYFTTSVPTPTSISAGSLTTSGATFTITDSNSPKINSFGTGYGYDIYWSTSSTAPNGNTTPSASTEDLSKAVTGLTAGTTYYFWVRGKGPDDKSSWVAGSGTTFTLPTLSTIAVQTAPTKTAYLVGENFDPTGLIITRNYSNSTSDTYTYANHTGEFSFSPATNVALAANNTSVTITYGTKTTTQAINVYTVTVNKVNTSGTAIDVAGVTATCTTRALAAGVSTTNYKFKNWEFDGDQNGLSISSTTDASTTITGTPSGNVTIKAVFYEPISVTWTSNGSESWGTKGSSFTAEVKYDTQWKDLTLPGDPSAPSSCSTKTFMGWTNMSDTWTGDTHDAAPTVCLKTFDGVTTAINEDITFKAVFATGSGDGTAELLTSEITAAYCSGNGGCGSVTSYANSPYTIESDDGDWYLNGSISNGSLSIKTDASNQAQGRCYMISPDYGATVSEIVINATHSSNDTRTILVCSSATNDPETNKIGSVVVPKNNGDNGLTIDELSSSVDQFYLYVSGGAVQIYSITVTYGSAEDYVTQCCSTLGAIDGTADATGTETTLTVKNWTAVSNVTNYTVKLYKKNAGEWELANNNSTTGGASGAQATRTAVTDRSTGVTWSGLTYGETYKVTVQAIGNGTSYCDGAETAIDVINGTALTSNEIPWKYSIYIDDATNKNYTHKWIESLSSHVGSVAFNLEANKDYYQYQLVLGGAVMWYGNTGKMVSGNSSNWTFTNNASNCKLQTGIGGEFTFAVNTAMPTVSVTYPDDDQASGYKIYWDNSVLNWSTIRYRIGNASHNSNQTPTLVTGTDKFYVTTTPQYNNIAAWHFANNYAWAGDGNSIYKTKTNGEQASIAITASSDFQQYVVTGDMTLVPTTTHTTGGDDQNNNCEFYTVNSSSGMLVHTATITTPTNGSISLAYTSKSGSPSTSTVSAMPHRSIITATAVPATGYQVNKLYVTPSGGAKTEITSGSSGNHILAKDATFEATFTAKTYTISLDRNGGTTGAEEVTMTYNSSSFTGWTAPTRTGYTFGGYYTSETDNNGTGTLVISSSGVLQAGVDGYTGAGGIWTKDATCTLYAKWTINSHTLTWNWGGGTCSGTAGTHYTAGGSVNYGATISYPDDSYLSKTGYHFTGWSSSPSGNPTTMPDQDLTITAQWTINTYTVTWYVNGVAYTTGDPTTSFTHGTTVAASDMPDAPSAPSNCSSKVFMGWSTTNVGSGDGHDDPGNIFTASAGTKPTITANTPIYAVFADEHDGGTSTVYVKRGNTTDYGTGTYILTSYRGYAFTGSISGGDASITATAFSYTNDTAKSAPSGAQELTITRVAANHYKISRTRYDETLETNVTEYLYAKAASAHKLAWHTSSDDEYSGNYYWHNSESGGPLRYSHTYTVSGQNRWAYIRTNESLSADVDIRSYMDKSGQTVYLVEKKEVDGGYTYDNYVTQCSAPVQVATPAITPTTSPETGSATVSITCATDGAAIYYTTDGTDPTSSSTLYEGSFTVSCSGTVKAIGIKSPLTNSTIASQAYTITVPRPTFSPNGGDFKTAQSVSLSNALAGTTVYYEYTTDGSEPSDPTSSSTAYSSTPISVAVGQTVRIKAIGISACATSSAIVSKTYRVGWDFELVTNEDDLNVGDKIVVLSGTTAAMSTYNTAGNNRTASTDFDISGTTVTAYPPSTNSATTVQVITLAGEAGAWKLVTSNTQWLNCPSAGKLTTVTSDGSSAEDLARRRWSIDVGSSPNYYATIQNNQETTATIQYSSVFAAYATSQSPVKIYSIPTTDPVLKVDGTLSAFTGCTSEASAAQSFYVSGKNLSASISVAAPTGYEVSLSSGSGYGSSVEVTRVGTTVSKTQVYVRLKAGDAGAVAAANVVVSVEANSLSQNVAIPASTIAAADTYIDRMHGAEPTNECGSYSAPVLDDGDMETGTDCQKNYAIFQGWVAEDDINLDGTLKAGATIVAGGASKTASGTTYYSIWEALVE